MIYTGTLYLYFTKKASRNQFVAWAISLSYGAYSALSIMNWYIAQSALVNHETQYALFAAVILGEDWVVLVSDVITFALAFVADGILIWRCYHVCGSSFRAILVPGFLLCCEIVIDLIVIGVNVKCLSSTTSSLCSILDVLISAQAFITFATTLSSTSIVAYRIYSTSRGVPGSSKRLLMRIFDILVQSAAAYSVLAIAWAISGVVPLSQTASNLVPWVAASDYTAVLFQFISGVAPTMLVARVSTLDESDVYASSTATSGLRFCAQSTQGDAESPPEFIREGNLH